MTINDIKKINIPSSPGVYQFVNKKNEIIYIGKAANLKSRVFSYLPRRRAGWQKNAEHSPAKAAMMKQIAKVRWTLTESEIEALLLESNLIKKYQPYFNVLMRDDKRFAYIKISLDDAIPGVFITRKIDKSGKYFGPFISALAVRETLRAIRKIWPYCTMRKPQQRPCFYYHLGRCLGICGGLITKKEYLERVIKPLILFLQGKKKSIIKKLEVRITRLQRKLASGQEKLEKEYDTNIPARFALRMQAGGRMNANDTNDANNLNNIEEQIKDMNYQLANMKRVLASANIISVGEKYANDVVELAKLLNLPRVPQRIEGYDISNIFGKEAVGSMVVFSGGEPDKSQYRKFKIKVGQGLANDVGMLREVLERRFKHSIVPLKKGGEGGLKEFDERFKIPLTPFIKGGKWLLPDLIIIDGGKAQVNVAFRILKKTNLDIPVIAISKGAGLRSAIAPDKLFFPGEKKPLELPLASPALHILKRVRDEAHRFAIGYHRKLRSRNSLL